MSTLAFQWGSSIAGFMSCSIKDNDVPWSDCYTELLCNYFDHMQGIQRRNSMSIFHVEYTKAGWNITGVQQGEYNFNPLASEIYGNYFDTLRLGLNGFLTFCRQHFEKHFCE